MGLTSLISGKWQEGSGNWEAVTGKWAAVERVERQAASHLICILSSNDKAKESNERFPPFHCSATNLVRIDALRK